MMCTIKVIKIEFDSLPQYPKDNWNCAENDSHN